MVVQERTPSGYLLETEEATLLVDTGTGITRNLRKTRFSTDDIDAVINTHRHPDHISDLVPIIQDKVVRSFEGEEPDIKLLGPEGHTDYLEKRMHGEMMESPDTVQENFGFEVDVRNIEDVSEIFGLKIETLEAEHGPEGFDCLSIRVSDGAKSIVFTGDTDYFEGLKDFAKDADLIVTDCSKPDNMKIEGHMIPTECAEIAEGANVEKLVLSHLYPEAESSEIEETAAKIFSRDIVVAEDLMCLDF